MDTFDGLMREVRLAVEVLAMRVTGGVQTVADWDERHGLLRAAAELAKCRAELNELCEHYGVDEAE